MSALKKLANHEEVLSQLLDSSHALAYALKMIEAEPEKEQLLIVNISGRGDKDIFTVQAILQAKGEI